MKIITKDLVLHSRCGLNRSPKRLSMFFVFFLSALCGSQSSNAGGPFSGFDIAPRNLYANIFCTPRCASACGSVHYASSTSVLRHEYATEISLCFGKCFWHFLGDLRGRRRWSQPGAESISRVSSGRGGIWQVFLAFLCGSSSRLLLCQFHFGRAMHTDPRYHPLRSGSAWARLKYTGASVVLTHTDSGKLTFNASQVLGSGMAASVSSLYYPERDRTASLVTQRWASNLAGDALLMGLKEFTPELVGIGKHVCSMISFGVLLCKDRQSTDH